MNTFKSKTLLTLLIFFQSITSFSKSESETVASNLSPLDLAGVWTSKVRCGNEEITASLNLYQGSSNNAIGGFIKSPPNPSIRGDYGGYYGVRGELRDGALRLVPEPAIRPQRFPQLAINAVVYSNPLRIVGTVQNFNCSPVDFRQESLFDNVQSAQQTPAYASGGSPSFLASNSAYPSNPNAKQNINVEKPRQGVSLTNTGLSHSEFVKRLGNAKLSSFIGVALKLNLHRGGDGGWAGFIEDPQSLVFFNCPKDSKFNGGPVTANIAKIRDNDSGVFVQLDRCE